MPKHTYRIPQWLYQAALVALLLAAATLRLAGLDWDESRHLHPDERFLTQVAAALHSVPSLGEYFNTASSTLNPSNAGFSFFVYGTLPVVLVRYVGEWTQMTGYDSIYLVGRVLSALADVGVIAMVYFTARRLFDRRVGLLAAAFYSVSVMAIQQSHFWTVDNFVNLFTVITVYFAVRVATPSTKAKGRFDLWDFVWFGVALGSAMASKVSVGLVCLTLPIAVIIRVQAMEAEWREAQLGKGVLYTLMAAGLSLLAFRIFQPYAFIGLRLNPEWVETMRQLAAQVSGDADWPPSMQWARRPLWFGLQNIVRWGLGWPLAITSWLGFGWAAWRALKGEWLKPYFVVLAWGLIYFVQQSLAFNPTMRYFLPLYPMLAILGAWGIFELWRLAAARRGAAAPAGRWLRAAALGLGILGVVGGLLWSLAFVQVYLQPHARVAATRWIYDNIPGPLTLTVQNEQGTSHQPLSLPYNTRIRGEMPLLTSFSARQGGLLTQLDFKTLQTPLALTLRSGASGEVLNADYGQVVDFANLPVGETSAVAMAVGATTFADPLALYQLHVQFPAGTGSLWVERVVVSHSQSSELPQQDVLDAPLLTQLGAALDLQFALAPGNFPDQVVLYLRPETALRPAPVPLRVQLSLSPDMAEPLLDTTLAVAPGGSLANAASLPLESPVTLQQGIIYYLQLSTLNATQAILQGSPVANETSWDDGLPLRIDSYDGFGGIYQGGLNFEMYWNENAEKVQRFQSTLDAADYVFISSNRQWGSLPRLPERFPLAITYYRALLGCPTERSIEWCYAEAQPGQFSGQLGFELVQVFENAPRLGSWSFNDQWAEEAFTVYDHPKVLIFKKTAAYDPAAVAAILASAPVDQAVNLTPKQASGGVPPTLMLPADRLAQQQAGGTWAALFSRQAWVNAAPWVSAVVWYLALGVLGVLAYPLVRWALPGLRDGGYPFARLAGLLLLAYLGWLGGSLGLSFTRAWLAVCALLIGLLGVLAARPQWPQIKAEWKSQRAMFLRTEALFLGFFLIMLLIRLGNPDLWHPAKGGEKPMDFAYFNAVLKSSSFPAYDPWFAGGYINYYYYGFVLVGALVKLLGIIPAVAYNLILPSLFAMLTLGAYSVAWNLWAAWQARQAVAARGPGAHAVGLSAALASVLLGNLGSIQMILQGYARLGGGGAALEGVGTLTQLGWMLRGLALSLTGTPLPYGLGEWYWNPTRIFPAPGESAPITEFPLFTFTYADLHAHMIALPVTLLALAWALSAVLSGGWGTARAQRGLRGALQLAWVFVFGGIVIGSLRPINTWDLPVYALLAALAAGYALWRYLPRSTAQGLPRSLKMLAGPLVLAALCYLAYVPFGWWYRQGYSSLRVWDGVHVAFGPYFTHWGVFLFFLVAWLAWETRQWLASTPLSSVRKLEGYVWALPLGALAIFLILFALQILGVVVGWLLVPLLLWIGALFLRPGQDESKRLVLFLSGTAVFLTLFVEVMVLKGDISRMNTVFKFYMQAWTLLALCASLAAAWCWQALPHWSPNWRGVWQGLATLLLACAALFLLLGVTAKIRDRMAEGSPHTLDGMAYMQNAVYYEADRVLMLSEDYAAIRWMQDHVSGSPVIMEGYVSEYRWGARYSIYTGLPAVLGWNHHQRQQREFVPGNDVWGRMGDVNLFYETTDLAQAEVLLAKYAVRYIVVGQMEQAVYSAEGLAKFAAAEGRLWQEVFRVGDTAIYEVLER
ncbi:MAG: glycosyltransferase family 39 protein [Anaerolineales bacterium]|nr:glycosyltransferase family 39 protein [Anaerolineales bacterium]